jgi:hypothetical protein
MEHNADGKRRRSPKGGGYQQLKAVGVRLTNQLGWGAKAGCCTAFVDAYTTGCCIDIIA